MTIPAATVEVPAHDLHRLLLAFRAAVDRGTKLGGWTHAADWGWSFERLADVLDAQRRADGALCRPAHPVPALQRLQLADIVKRPCVRYRPCGTCESGRQLQGLPVDE